MAGGDPLLSELRQMLPRGRSRPLSAKAIAGYFGINQRSVGQLIADLIDRGVLIGSTCNGDAHGFFLIDNQEDLEAGVGHIVRRAAAMFQRVRKLRRAAERAFGPDVLTLFDLDEARSPASREAPSSFRTRLKVATSSGMTPSYPTPPTVARLSTSSSPA